MSQALQTPASVPPPAPNRRERSRKRRSDFLRRFRAHGEVKAAAEQTGIAHATLYRWRAQDEDFRARWDSAGDQRRFELEDLMMQIAREGEKSEVFYKGEQVGCRVNRLKPVLAMMAYLDRQERKRLEAEKRVLESHFSTVDPGEKAQSADVEGNNDNVESDGGESDAAAAWDEEAERQEEVEEEAEAREDKEAREAREAREAQEAQEAKEAQEAEAAKQAPVPKPKERSFLVRIVNTPYFDNIRLHLPGAIVEIPNRQAFSSVCMEELKAGEILERLTAFGAVRGAMPGVHGLERQRR